MKVLGPVPVESLLLDPENPRLPEEKQGADQATILAYLYEHDVLTELVDSYLTNGFFANEAILVLPAHADGTRVVVEGNRRLGALKYLHHDHVAIEAALPEHDVLPQPDPAVLDALKQVPVIELQDRDQLSSYLGFRHISGLKTWTPEAKARYLYGEVNKARATGASDPFYAIGRKVGSNALGVRNAYYAFHALREARDKFGLRDLATYVLNERFGVWTRLLGTANVAGYIGLAPVSSDYDAATASTNNINVDTLAAVLRDLAPRNGRNRALLNDSRDVTDYSAVLGNAQALEVMRQYDRLDLAAEIARGSDFNNRMQRVLDILQVATREAHDGAIIGRETLRIVAAVIKEARTLEAVMKVGLSDNEEQE